MAHILSQEEVNALLRTQAKSEGELSLSLRSYADTAGPSGATRRPVAAVSQPQAVRIYRGGAPEVVAQLQSGVLANVKVCQAGWCRVFGDGFDGFIKQGDLWGVYPDEKFD